MQKLPKPDLTPRPRISTFVLLAVLVTAACTPIIIKPYFNSAHYQKIQNEMRPQFGKTREELQPGGLRPWSDPFKKRED